MSVRQIRNHIDLVLFLAVLALMVMSLGVVYSASSTYSMVKWNESGRLLERHLMKVGAGIVAIFFFMQIDYRVYRKLTKPALIMAIVLLLVTLALGGELKGASRWLRFGGFGFQPSEFAKYALLFHLCVLITDKKKRIEDFATGFMPMLIWIVPVTALVLAQPNFSNGAMIFTMSIVLLFIGRAKLLHIAGTLGACVPVLGLVMLMAPYRMQRILSYLGGSGAAGKIHYQLDQAIIGFGNGGVFGLGLGGSRQRELFLPESYGDFVFSIVGEEWGLIGALLTMFVFLLIMLRGLKIAKHAPDDLGRILAFAITTSITLYALVNAGVTLGILPTTGLPMPFVSYGGSSIFFTSIAVGVLLNISMQTDLYPRLAGTPDSIRPIEPVRAAAAGRVS